MKHELPKLTYSYDALEPFIDAQTMEIHHTKHHQAYVNKLNEALLKHEEIANQNLADLLADLDSIPEDIKTAVRNHGGGHYNHSFFWELMAQNPQKQPTGGLLKLIETVFDNTESMIEKFNTEALNRFGSGWAWLSLDKNKTLKIYSTPNQDNPLMQGEYPLIGLDVWEHAYYLKYQNKRADYIQNWWNVVDWKAVELQFEKALTYLG